MEDAMFLRGRTKQMKWRTHWAVKRGEVLLLVIGGSRWKRCCITEEATSQLSGPVQWFIVSPVESGARETSGTVEPIHAWKIAISNCCLRFLIEIEGGWPVCITTNDVSVFLAVLWLTYSWIKHRSICESRRWITLRKRLLLFFLVWLKTRRCHGYMSVGWIAL